MKVENKRINNAEPRGPKLGKQVHEADIPEELERQKLSQIPQNEQPADLGHEGEDEFPGRQSSQEGSRD